MENKDNNPLVGAWKLASFEVRRKNGATHHPFGNNARGIILYTDTGRVSVSMSQNGRPQVKSGDMMDASHEEMAASFRGYIGYFGRYEYDAKNNTVLHHVKGSLFPNWIGDTLKRKVKIEGDKLELMTEPTLYGTEDVTAVVTWERIAE